MTGFHKDGDYTAWLKLVKQARTHGTFVGASSPGRFRLSTQAFDWLVEKIHDVGLRRTGTEFRVRWHRLVQCDFTAMLDHQSLTAIPAGSKNSLNPEENASEHSLCFVKFTGD